MKLSIILVTFDYRGDHSADVAIAFECRPDETVEQLVKRVNLKQAVDKIEIRLVESAGPVRLKE